MLVTFGIHLLTETLDNLTAKPLLIHGARTQEVIDMSTDPTMRDGAIYQAQQERMTKDTLILQKINATHRVAFSEKFPGQIEHNLRLLTERLQAGLDKRDGVDLDSPTTWKMHPDELAHMARAILDIYTVKERLNNV
jgi:hypothetical protein